MAAEDEFDQIVLDEDFVAAATINEDSAADRHATPPPSASNRPATRSKHRSARPRRRSFAIWLRPPPSPPSMRSWTAAQWVTTVVAVAVVGLALWFGVRGGGSGSPHLSPPTTVTSTTVSSRPPLTPPPAYTPGSSPTTVAGLVPPSTPPGAAPG